MKPGSIPTETVAPKLAMLIRDRWPHGGGLDVLAEKVGCDVSALEGVLAQDSPGVAFDLADALFCALGRPMEDVGLGDIYWAFDLEGEASRDYIPKGHLRCQRTGCGKIFQPHTGRQRPGLISLATARLLVTTPHIGIGCVASRGASMGRGITFARWSAPRATI